MGCVLGLIVEANTQKGREDRDQSLLTVANHLQVYSKSARTEGAETFIVCIG